MYNFISTFDELNKLYEEVDVKKAEEVRADELAEAADEEIPVEEIPAEEEAPIEEPVAEEEPRQLICECDKCGALVIKDEAGIVADEESDLVNIEEECQFCEEAKGFKIVGVVAPYEVAEEVTEAFGLFKNKKPKPWSELEATHKLVPTKVNNFKVGDWTMTKPDQDINDVTGKALVYPVTGVIKLDSDTVVLKFEGSHGLNTNQNTVLLKAVKNDTVDEEFEVANEEHIEEGLLDGRQTKVGEFEFKYQGTIASTKGISDPEVLAKLYAKRKGLEYGQVYNDLAHSNYRDNLFLTSSGVIFKNNKKNTYSITWKDELTNKKITEVVPSQSNFKIEGSDTEVKDILVEILSDYYAQITITGVDNYIGDDDELEELFDIKPSVSLGLHGGSGNDVSVLGH